MDMDDAADAVETAAAGERYHAGSRVEIRLRDALEAFTGSREMSGDALIAYFQPLLAWLRDQNRGRQCGWTGPAAS